MSMILEYMEVSVGVVMKTFPGLEKKAMPVTAVEKSTSAERFGNSFAVFRNVGRNGVGG
jgi:hypothetical protein